MSALLVFLLLLLNPSAHGRIFEDGSAVLEVRDCTYTVPAFDSPNDRVTVVCIAPTPRNRH